MTKRPEIDLSKFERARAVESTSSFEKIAGQYTNFLVAPGWFEAGARVSSAIGRILTPEGMGTGWLINGGFLITNNHVISDDRNLTECTVQFDFGTSIGGNIQVPVSFQIVELLHTEPELDYTILRVLGNPAARFGFIDLSASKLPDPNDVEFRFPVVIQHPSGGRKMFSGFENEFAERTGHLVWYTSDTEPGSSGSPVMTQNFQVFALHHAGGPHLIGGKTKILNEGVLIRSILDDLKQNAPAVLRDMGLGDNDEVVNRSIIQALNGGLLGKFIRTLQTRDVESGKIELARLNDLIINPEGPFTDLRDSLLVHFASQDKEIAPLVIALLGVASGAGAAHWAHRTSREVTTGASKIDLSSPFILDFGALLNERFKFKGSGGGAISLPGVSVAGGVDVKFEGISIGGGLTITVEKASSLGVVFEGTSAVLRRAEPLSLAELVRVLPLSPEAQCAMGPHDKSSQGKEVFPMAVAIYLAGVSAGAAAYKAGK